MENENKAMDVAEEAIDDVVCVEGLKSKKILKAPIIMLCVGAAVAGIAVVARKRKGKIKAMRIGKAIKYLEKNGYNVESDSISLFDDEGVEVNPEKE